MRPGWFVAELLQIEPNLCFHCLSPINIKWKIITFYTDFLIFLPVVQALLAPSLHTLLCIWEAGRAAQAGRDLKHS